VRRLWVEQQVLASTYSIFKRTYVERGCCGVRGSLQGEGRVQSPSELMDGARARCRPVNRCQQNTYSICKMYVHGEGRYGVQPSLRGRGGVQGPGDAARGLWVGQHISAKHVQHL
jgi:hypothetical protein